MKSPVAASLRPATPADVALALSWTPGDDALRRWAGPNTRCSATPESLWADIAHAEAATFALISREHGFVGLGQVRLRDNTHGHLARIIVSPHHRGLGLGRALCTALMHEAVRRHPDIKAFTLFVYPDNTKALSLYLSLGFVEKGMHPTFPCLLMEAPLSALKDEM